MSETVIKSDLDPNWKIPEHTPIAPAKLETVTISKTAYGDLVNDQKFLRALEAAGVDNWEGYDYAQELVDYD